MKCNDAIDFIQALSSLERYCRGRYRVLQLFIFIIARYLEQLARHGSIK